MDWSVGVSVESTSDSVILLVGCVWGQEQHKPKLPNPNPYARQVGPVLYFLM